MSGIVLIAMNCGNMVLQKANFSLLQLRYIFVFLGRGPVPAVLWPLPTPGSGEEEVGRFSGVGPPADPLLEVFFSGFDLGTVWFWVGGELEG